MTKMIPAAIALAFVLTTAPSAWADNAKVSVLKANLAYRTAELETPQGARALLTRVNSLALRMCRTSSNSPLVHPVASEIEACREKAVSRAVADLGAPLVTAAYVDRQSADIAAR